MEESPPTPTSASQEPDAPVQTPQEASVEKTEDGRTSPDQSDYDSAASYSDEEQHRDGSRGHSGSESEGSVGVERQSGDGQESVPPKKVDDDEDKKNPQYIPKRGTFYEHDDRTADDADETNEPETEKEKDAKKKVWQDKKERWSHDRFNDLEQAPKSRSELVAIYGYDIRNEDGPPKARRRRRYGRGPNKYTRNWEDEDAYSKPVAAPRVKKPPRKSNGRNEEFPPLGDSNQDHQNRNQIEDDFERGDNQRDYNTEKEEHQSEANGNVHKISQQQTSQTESYRNPQQTSAHQQNQDSYRPQQRVGSGRVIKPKREIKDSDYKGFTTKTRQVRNMKTDQKILSKTQKKDDFIQSQNFTNRNNNIQDLEKDMSKLNVQDGVYKGGSNSKHGGQRQGSVPPRLQSEQKGSKRYSSIRQRSLPESATPPFNQHSNYYPNEYNQQGQVSQPNIIHPSNPQVPQIAPPPLPPIPQVPVTATPILQPPQFAPAFPQGPPPFLQPGVAPPPFIPQQTPQLINYVPSQPQFPQGYQGYQQQFNPVTQPAELFQPPSGITYYSTDQQVSQRAAPLKRPKAAIPIVAPPPIDLKGKHFAGKDEEGGYEADAGNPQEQNEGSSNLQESEPVSVHQ